MSKQNKELFSKTSQLSQVLCYIPVISVPWKAEAERSEIQLHHGQLSETLSPNLKIINKKIFKRLGMDLSTKALDSIPDTKMKQIKQIHSSASACLVPVIFGTG